MADRFNRSSRGQAVNIVPFAVPDLQSGMAKQLSFIDTLQKMQARAAAQSATASQGTFVGLDPETGEPVYAKGLPGKTTEKMREQAFNVMMKQKLRNVIGKDEELNRIKNELYSGRPLSTQRQALLLEQARKRTKALADANGLDHAGAFEETFGTATQTYGEDIAKLNKSGAGSAFLSGLEQGWNTLKAGVRQGVAALTGDSEEKIRIADENTKRNQEIALANPILRERTLREQEAAAEGKELGYFEATDGNTFSNIAATAGNLVGSFGPAIVATPVLSTVGAPATVAALAPSIAVSALTGQEGYNERVAATEGLTQQQKEEAVDLTNPGAALNLGINAAAGALLPGRMLGSTKQWLGNQVAQRIAGKPLSKLAAVTPRSRAVATGEARFIPSGAPEYVPNGLATPGGGVLLAKATPGGVAQEMRSLNPLQAHILSTGQAAAARAAAPRSAGTFIRDVAGNSMENAAIMGAATIGSNAAYNWGAGQETPLTQGLAEGAVEGALLGIPFGALQYRGRGKRAATSVSPDSSAAPTAPTLAPSAGSGEGASAEVQGMFGKKTASTGNKAAKVQPRYKSEDWNAAIDAYMNPAEADVASIIADRKAHFTNESAATLNADPEFRAWFKDVIAASRKKDDAAVDNLIGEYLASGGDIKDLEYVVTTNAGGKWLGRPAKELIRIDPAGLGEWNKEARKTFAAGVAHAKQQGAEYAGQFQPREGLRGILGKLERGRAAEPAGEGAGNGSKVDTNPPKSPTDTAARPDAPPSFDSSSTESGGFSGAAQQSIISNETPPAAPKADSTITGQEADSGRNVDSPRPGDEQAGVGAGGTAGQTGRSDGSGSDAASASIGAEPDGVVEPKPDFVNDSLRTFATDDAVLTKRMLNAINRRLASGANDVSTALVDTLINSPFVRKLYNSMSEADLASGNIQGVTPQAIKNAQDYVRFTKMANLPRNVRTLRDYLTDVFDPRTAEDINSRDTQIC